MVGVATATAGDVEFTPLGFGITFFCVLLAALKAVVSSKFLTVSRFTLHSHR
jgi:hypothetical protein